ncbi:MAG: dihydroorotase [Thermoplasmatota archaeon]
MKVRGKLYQNGKLEPGVLVIEDGTIIAVEPDGPVGGDDLDFGDKAILPGAIDIHVHFRDPGAPTKEDFHTGSVSAAFGGVTAVVDMPNTNPPTTTWNALCEKLRIADEKSVVDYAAWCGATWFLDDLPKMLPHSPGIKIYLGATTGDLLMEDQNRVRQALEAAGKAGKPVALHCEAQRVLNQFKRPEKELQDHDDTRPPLAEVESIFDVMKALPTLKHKPVIHVAHIASQDAVVAAEKAGFSRGVCPHHLLLDTESCCDHNPGYGKMNPPVRKPINKEALYACYKDGRIPILESDHAPHTKTEKAGDFGKIPAGVPGVETMLPLLLAEAVKGKLDFSLVVDSATVAPAALLGVKKGELVPGMNADFAVYDLQPAPVDPAELHSKCGWSPFEGHDACFPSDVYVRGNPVVVDRTLVAKPGAGAPLYPLP